MPSSRPQSFNFHNGTKAALPFTNDEYARRLTRLRETMQIADISAVMLSSMQTIAYYSGFLYCSFGRPYGCVITAEQCTTISANIDGGQPWRRSVAENVVYTDWQRDNFWRTVKDQVRGAKRVGIEFDHLTLTARNALENALRPREFVDIADASMRQRMIKSDEELALITASAGIADIGGVAIHAAIGPGVSELEVAQAGRDAMENAIAQHFPDSELRDTWVWFQSGTNTDGAHNPVTTRKLERGDILSLNTFPMISGYYTALERTLFLGEPDSPSRKVWEANVATHELGLSLLGPGVSCASVCTTLNSFIEEQDLLQFRSFGYGHSFGVLSHYYGREAALELREDIDTVLAPGMVISMEPMLTLPEGMPGAGGYREHDIVIITERGARNITGFPYGPEHNVIA
ncbi:MAG: creatinase [Gammaproteobacteria bacterium]|jgi:creatinase